ncbi:MAG: hypothetical protein KGJ78_02485 [Alphaproteobacteria bacterium]|nr:hypothetical protein [Alphaproteobacteria bacterium]
MCRWFAIVGAMLVLPASADDKPIREFDLATIEALGQHMYRQDQEAWKATDILLAKHSLADLQSGRIRAWIVDDDGSDLNVVRFIRSGANGPEAVYDVAFVPGEEPKLTEPLVGTLQSVEIAQYNARELAAENFDFRCSNEPANTIAFWDPHGKSWLVWVMSVTKDPQQMMIGGHERFTISADGKSIIQKDALSKSCLMLSKTGQSGEKPVAYYFTHIVSNTPVETHVFASLSYRATFFVGTSATDVWSIEGGRITKVK